MTDLVHAFFAEAPKVLSRELHHQGGGNLVICSAEEDFDLEESRSIVCWPSESTL